MSVEYLDFQLFFLTVGRGRGKLYYYWKYEEGRGYWYCANCCMNTGIKQTKEIKKCPKCGSSKGFGGRPHFHALIDFGKNVSMVELMRFISPKSFDAGKFKVDVWARNYQRQHAWVERTSTVKEVLMMAWLSKKWNFGYVYANEIPHVRGVVWYVRKDFVKDTGYRLLNVNKQKTQKSNSVKLKDKNEALYQYLGVIKKSKARFLVYSTKRNFMAYYRSVIPDSSQPREMYFKIFRDIEDGVYG